MRSSVLCFLAAALLLGSCAPVPVRDSAGDRPEPAGITESASFGFKQVSGPTPVTNGETSITVTAAQDLALTAYMKTTGVDAAAISVPIEKTGKNTWTLRPVFPEIARCVITLLGKAATDSSTVYARLAEWSVEATSARARTTANIGTTGGPAGAGPGGD